MKIPPILLEGDLPPSPRLTGPGARYALGTEAPAVAVPRAQGELPEGYGTKRLFLTARDPHWLYASWDLTSEQQRGFNHRSRDGHLILRVFAENGSTPIVPEIHVNPESRTWFINVPQAETRYHAQLGFIGKSGAWEIISTSRETFTPPSTPSAESALEFATVPPHVTFEEVVQTVQEFITGHQPLLEAVAAAQAAEQQLPPTAEPELLRNLIEERPVSSQTGHVSTLPPQPGIPPPQPPPPIQNLAPRPAKTPSAPAPAPLRARHGDLPVRVGRAQPWTPERTAALKRLIHLDQYRRVWMGSIEITELVRRQLQEEVSSIAAAELARAAHAAAVSPGEEGFGLSSFPGGAQRRRRGFWFKVNAELIVYGATEPDARVTIGDRPIQLRPDGTFSFRFSLPDGQYELPAVASSADGEEARLARLHFGRSTEYRGEVEPHPQDLALRPPGPENL